MISDGHGASSATCPNIAISAALRSKAAGAVQVWQALRPSAVESRFEALRAASLGPLVGREEEIELLLRR